MTSQQFAQKAALGGQKEIFLSQVALRKSDNSQIKSFAQQMVRDHSAVGQQLAQIAQTKGIQLPPTNAFETALESATATAQTRPSAETSTSRPTDIEQRRTPTGRPETAKTPLAVPESELEAARKLERLSGSQFDRAYIAEMVSDHRKTVTKFERASQSLDDAELKQFATDTLPKIREHTSHAEQLSQTLGAKRY
jgi:putative membrane protein